MMQLESRESIINTPPYLSWHLKWVCAIQRFWPEEYRNSVRRYDRVPGREEPPYCVDLRNLGKSEWDQKHGNIECVFHCMMIRWDDVYLPRGLPKIYPPSLSPSPLPLYLRTPPASFPLPSWVAVVVRNGFSWVRHQPQRQQVPPMRMLRGDCISMTTYVYIRIISDTSNAGTSPAPGPSRTTGSFVAFRFPRRTCNRSNSKPDTFIAGYEYAQVILAVVGRILTQEMVERIQQNPSLSHVTISDCDSDFPSEPNLATYSGHIFGLRGKLVRHQARIKWVFDHSCWSYQLKRNLCTNARAFEFAGPFLEVQSGSPSGYYSTLVQFRYCSLRCGTWGVNSIQIDGQTFEIVSSEIYRVE